MTQSLLAPRRLAILGSTGSIGRQTLDVVRAYPHHFQVKALAAHSHVDLLAAQAQTFAPEVLACSNTSATTRQQLAEMLPGASAGPEGLLACVTHPEVDIVVAAQAGVEGIVPLLAAIAAGKQIALANKEALVMAGHLVMAAARQAGCHIFPIDSEHSAIWQCLRGEDSNEVRHLILTASGGAFRNVPFAQMRAATVEQALSHPTWQMGPKISIDSATLMNKGLEVIEAHWLFNLPYDQIQVVVHPQSIIHSMVEFVDGSIKMQASQPSMHLPIQDALSYPWRLNCAGTVLDHPLSWPQVGRLDFAEVDMERFPCLRLAYEAGQRGGTAPAVLAGADEQAVLLFRQGVLRLTQIAEVIEVVLARHRVIPDPDLSTVLAAAQWAQEEVQYVHTGVSL